MHSPALKERVICHAPLRKVCGKGVIIGLLYSITIGSSQPD
jgi:hypothetical protein